MRLGAPALSEAQLRLTISHIEGALTIADMQVHKVLTKGLPSSAIPESLQDARGEGDDDTCGSTTYENARALQHTTRSWLMFKVVSLDRLFQDIPECPRHA